MAEDLQSIVDDLAEQLGRSVVIDDPGVRLICASRHFGDEDPVRVRAVLQRSAGSDVIAFVLGQNPDRWPGSGMLGGSAALGLLPRFCVPLREQGVLLGYLMVIDADGTLTGREIAATERGARAAAALLHDDRAGDDGERAVVEQALRDLVGGGIAERESARDRLVRDRLLRDAPLAVVTVVTVKPGADPPARVELAYRTALRGFAPSSTARGTVDAERATLVQLRSRPATGEELRAQAACMIDVVGSMLDPATAPVAGVGGHAAGMRDAWITCRQAVIAARSAPGPGGIGFWDELGELAVLAQLPADALVVEAVAGPLRALAEHDASGRLRATLRSYLDHAGSVPRTAAELHLHRTSLYYRLGQIRDITGLDLDDGRARLLLHLGLRLDDLGFPTE